MKNHVYLNKETNTDFMKTHASFASSHMLSNVSFIFLFLSFHYIVTFISVLYFVVQRLCLVVYGKLFTTLFVGNKQYKQANNKIWYRVVFKTDQ